MQRGELTADLGVNVGASAAAPDEEIESMQDKLGVLHYVRACACVSLTSPQPWMKEGWDARNKYETEFAMQSDSLGHTSSSSSAP